MNVVNNLKALLNAFSCKIEFFAGLILSSFFLLPVTIQAQVISLEMFTLNDGTGPFTAIDRAGDDASANNEIVRTHDEITYRAIFKTSGGDTNVVGNFTLPDIDSGPTTGEPTATWREIPPQCIGINSAISSDGLTLSCDLGNLPNATTQSIEPVATVSGKAPNGQEIDFTNPAAGKGFANASSDQSNKINATYFDTLAGPNQGSIAVDGILDQVVSAAPRFDLMLGNNLAHREGTTGSQAHAFNGQAGPANEDGLSLTYGVFMFAHEIKGSEMLDPNSNFSYNLALTPSVNNPIPQASLDAATLVSWNGPRGNQQQNLNPGCKNGSLNSFFMPSDGGPSITNYQRYVRNGGSISCTQTSSGADIQATISGIDTSLGHFPTYLRTGGGTNPTDSNEWYVMSKVVSQFIPSNTLPAVGGLFYLDACVTMTSAPVSISGQTNIDPNAYTDETDNGGISNHCKTNGFRRTIGGSFHKIYGKGSVGGAPAATQDPRIIGDDRVNFVSPGQQYRSRVYAYNRGSEPLHYRQCEKIDNARQKVITGPAWSNLVSTSYRSVSGKPTVEWGVQLGDGSGNITDSWGVYPNANLLSLGGNEYSGSTISGSGTLFENALCPDADPTGNTAGAPVAYFTDHASLLAAGYSLDQVTMVRFTGELLGGDQHFNFIQLELRPTFRYASKDVFLKPTGPDLVYNAGAPIPSGSHVPNYVSGIIYDPDTNKEVSRTRFAVDVIQVQSTRSLRIKKTAVPISGLQVAPGQTINYKITPNYTTPDLGTPADVTVTDILPVGLTYLATSNGPIPTVEIDTPATGMTRLIWVLQNQIPATSAVGGTAGNLSPIEFTARVNTNTLSGTQFVNWTTLSDAGLDSENEPDCAFNLGAFPANPPIGYRDCTTSFSSTPVKADDTVHIMSAPPGFSLFKEVLDPIIYPGAAFTHRINWAPIGGATSGLRIIDILPWNGDARGSSFTGTLSLTAVTPIGDLLADNPTIYYTKTPPAIINQDPFVTSNNLIAAGIWCDTGTNPITPDIGTTNCPASIANSTAILIDQPTQLDANSTYSAEISFSTTGNTEDNIYANNHTANDSGSDLDLLVGNTVTSTVLEPSVGDRVWHDYNADGIEDAVEPGIENVTITLTGTDITGIAVDISTTTDASGFYLFNKNNGLIRPSNPDGYTITVNPPTGFTPTYDLDDGAFYFSSSTAASPSISPSSSSDEIIASADESVPADSTVSLNIAEENNNSNNITPAAEAVTPNDIAPLDTPNSSGSFVLTASDDKRDVDFAYTQFGSILVNKDVIGGDSIDAWEFTLASEVDGCVIPPSIANPAGTPNGGDSSALFPNLSLFSSTSGDACTYNVIETTQIGYVLNLTLSETSTGLAPTPQNRQATVKFSNQKLGAITGNVSEDIDGSGNASQVMLENITLTLLNADGSVYDNDPAIEGEQPITTLSNQDGNYTFSNIPLGEYIIQQTDLTGYSSIRDGDSSEDDDNTANTDINNNQIPVTLTAGKVDENNDFIDERPGSITGTVSEDIDVSGSAILTPLENITLTLLNTDGSIYDSDSITSGVQPLIALSNQDGGFSFSNVPLGEYILQQTDLAGYSSVSDADSSEDNDTSTNTNTNDNQIPVTLTPAEVDANNNFIDEHLGSITGNVFEDIDGAGNTALVPLKDITLILLNADGSKYDKSPNSAGVQEFLVTTNVNGNYNFTNIPLGEYIVEEIDKANFHSISDEDISDDGDTTLNIATNDNQIPITITAAEIDAGNNFIDEQRGVISGNVSEDTDGSGNATFVPLENIIITLLNGDGSVYDSDPETVGIQPLPVFTNQDGNYQFSNIPLGEYIIEQTDKANYRSVVDEDTSDDGDTKNNSNSNNNQIPVTLTAAEIDANNNFIDERPGSISGQVFEDVDGTGNATLVPIKGVTLTLFNADGSIYDNDLELTGIQELTEATDSTGSYTFNTIRLGDYIIQEIDLATYSSRSDLDNSEDGDNIDNTNTNDNQIPVSLTAAKVDTDNNFVDERTGSISGNVSVESNGDKPYLPLANVIVNLLDGDGKPVKDSDDNAINATTNDDGNYSFLDIPPGNYQIHQVQPRGFLSVSDVEGELLDNLISHIELKPAGNVINKDFIEKPAPHSEAIPTLNEWAILILMMMLGYTAYRQAKILEIKST